MFESVNVRRNSGLAAHFICCCTRKVSIKAVSFVVAEVDCPVVRSSSSCLCVRMKVLVSEFLNKGVSYNLLLMYVFKSCNEIRRYGLGAKIWLQHFLTSPFME